jgi:tetratricopeptide (TPR) repeat protein
VVQAAAGAAGQLPAEVIEILVERADGVPLFAEELVRSVVESGARGRAEGGAEASSDAAYLQIPSTLQDSLMARLDRLGAGKQVAQIAAALGRTFSHALIEAVAELDPGELRWGLAELVDAEILYQSGAPPRSSYTFKHALLQDTAYESQLKSRRRELHARIAATMKEQFPQRVVAEPEVIARHCAAGGLVPEAAEHYKQAGDQAVARLAYREAHGYFARALELLGALPETAGRHAKEIDLRMAQAAPLGALRGYEDPEFLASIARTEQLIEAVGPGPQQIPGLLRLMLLHTNQLPRARAYANSLLAVVEPLGIAPLRVAGYMIRGTGALTSATVSEACADLKQALEIAETTELQTPKAAFEVDAVAMGCCTYAIALVLSGKPDTATRLIERGVRRARAIGHPRTLASALQNAAMAFYMMDDAARSGELSDQCLELIDGRGFHHVEASARVLSGWARACRGDRAAIDGMDAALRSAEEHGVLSGMAKLHFTSAEAHARVGSYARAVEQLKRGEAFIGRAGEQFGYEPEALLTRARIMLLEGAGGDFDEIESLLLRSHQLWQRNQSPWYSILTATLLGRVALDTGKRAVSARERLAEVYAGFSEGFESERLRDARAVMDRLANA